MVFVFLLNFSFFLKKKMRAVQMEWTDMRRLLAVQEVPDGTFLKKNPLTDVSKLSEIRFEALKLCNVRPGEDASSFVGGRRDHWNFFLIRERIGCWKILKIFTHAVFYLINVPLIYCTQRERGTQNDPFLIVRIPA